MNGADRLCDTLLVNDVDVCFANPGTSEMHFVAALDRKLRRDMQIELQNLQRDVGITFLLVTHDQEEALSMSDRVCVMREGRIVQTGSPRELYDQPVNRYVADFVGKTNFFEGATKAEVLSVRPEQIEIAAHMGSLPDGLSRWPISWRCGPAPNGAWRC